MARRDFSASRIPGFATIAILVFVALYLPIMILVVYSFNAGDSIAVWEGFSLRWYPEAWNNDQVREVTLRSLTIATFAAIIATTGRHHGGARHHPAAAHEGADGHLPDDQPAAHGARDRDGRGASDLLRLDQGGDRLSGAGLPDPRPCGLLHSFRLPADPRAARGDGPAASRPLPPTSMPRRGRPSAT